MPGAGQFMTGRPGEGALHLGAELLIAGGAWRGAHANLADGTVSFEPVIGLGSIGGGLRVRFH